MKNQEVAKLLYDIANLLELKGVNVYRIVAYREAARNVEHLPEPIEDLDAEGKLMEIPRVGEAIAKKIHEFLTTGTLGYRDELRKEFPPGLMEVQEVPNIGPKLTKLLYEELGIASVEDLKKAAKEHRIRHLPRMGARAEEKILKGINMLKERSGRLLLGVALPAAEEVMEYLKGKGVEHISPAGSIRRGKETIGDIDILIASKTPREVMQDFTTLPIVKEVLLTGETKSSILTKGNLQIDLRVVPPESWGAALQYFTGSKAHNIRLREKALKKGWKINEYGIFEGDKKIGGEQEDDIYELLGLQYIPPEMREDTGEIKAAEKGELPELLSLRDIKGDIHAHTTWSDGNASIEDMAKAARAMDYEYLAVCDHAKSLGIAGGLTEEQLSEQRNEIMRVREELDFHLLTGVEVNIMSDRSLDLEDSTLKDLDIVVAGIHTGFNQSSEKITSRIVSAMENKHVDIISHPTGRLIERRPPYEVDVDKILEVAKETKTSLEINAAPDRLDLKDMDARKAKNKDVRIAISTDAHSTDTLDYMKFGVSTARRGWLEARDVLNTRSFEGLKKWLSSRK
ncbi:MAG: DNA polymerase/3'-5' exonuclease PolX [Candidatus Hydrothermarchaeales archaeon]